MIKTDLIYFSGLTDSVKVWKNGTRVLYVDKLKVFLNGHLYHPYPNMGKLTLLKINVFHE